MIYAKVFSSGPISPARAPPSIDILQTVILPSTDKSEIAFPVYSMTDPVPPPAPISPIIDKIMSLAVTPFGAVPPTLTLKFLAFLCIRVCVARICSTSDVPIPIAKAPNAP